MSICLKRNVNAQYLIDTFIRAGDYDKFASIKRPSLYSDKGKSGKFMSVFERY